MEDNDVKHKENVNVNRDAVLKVLKVDEEKGYLGQDSYLSDEANLEYYNFKDF